MLSPFYAVAKDRIDPIVKPLGFHSYRRYYYRIINDVVQQFCPLWLSHHVTLRFTIGSVYADNDRQREGNEVKRLIDGTNGWLASAATEIGPGRYVANEDFLLLTPNTYQIAADVCEDALKQHLLPWFEENTDSEKAYNACKSNRLCGFAQSSDKNVEPFGALGFLLGMEEWSRAYESLRPYMQHTIHSRWWSKVEPEYTPLYHALEKQNVSFIQNYMEEKRQRNYKEFKWKSRV